MSYGDVKRGYPNKDAQVIAIINQKGGVGKSTTAVNLSAALGELKKKVLVIDFDPQGNTTSGYGISKDDLDNDIYDVIMNEIPIGSTIQSTIEENVFLVPATIQLAGAEIELVSVMARENVLKTAVDSIKDEFDYVLIDCPARIVAIEGSAVDVRTSAELRHRDLVEGHDIEHAEERLLDDVPRPEDSLVFHHGQLPTLYIQVWLLVYVYHRLALMRQWNCRPGTW